MSEMDQLTVVDPQALARREPSVGDMIQAVISGGITAESVGVMEKLAELYERMQDKKSEREFTAAFNSLQSEMPIITATSVIPNRGKYERFEDIMRVVGPLLQRNGFTVSFSMDFNENRILETCHLKHVGGHTVKNTFAVRAGGKSDTETQADCKAATTAKRNALQNALNIVIQQDCLDAEHDAAIEGAFITREQAESIKKRVMDTGSDASLCLKFAGAKTFEEITGAKYPLIDSILKKKENTK